MLSIGASRRAGSARTPAWFYILRLQSTNLYSGSTRSLEKRIQDHFAGKGCHTTRIDRPIALVYSEEHPTYKEAYRREQQVKRWTRAKKEALIAGDLDQLKKLAKRRTM
jgi:putative endonuclease